MSEEAKDALKLVHDVAKQLVTLCAALIGAYVAAVKADVIQTLDGDWSPAIFMGAMFLCILLGFLTQLSIAGAFDAVAYPDRSASARRAADKPSVYAQPIRLYSSLMLGAFLIGIGALAAMAL